MKKLLIITAGLLLAATGCKKDNSISPSAGTHYVTPADYLKSTDFDKLVIQIVYVDGNQPAQASVDNMKAFLTAHLNKPNGIEIVLKSVKSPGKGTYTLDDIKAVEKLYRDNTNTSRVLQAYMFFADGNYSEDSNSSKVLGVTYTTGSIAIFEKTISSISGGLGQPSLESIETIVMEHEFGHILGLVNNGTTMVTSHQDTPHGNHCDNRNCLMYYNTETSDMLANLTGNSLPALDANCLNDLKAAGGK